jgi:hypothetical protein
MVVRHERPASVPPDAEWNTGQELQFLPQFEPYDQGVSTYALAYNYAKRAEVLMNVSTQKPLQVSDSVIDSRPALELKTWAEEEWERGRTFELKLFGLPTPKERGEMEAPTAQVALDQKLVDPAELQKAIFCYRTAARLGVGARAEYRRHLAKPQYVDKAYIYGSHIDGMQAMEQLVTADAFYLQAMSTTDPAARKAVLQQAAENYRNSIVGHELITLKYYVDDHFLRPVLGDVKKDQLGMLAPERIREILAAAVAESKKRPEQDSYVEDRAEYEGYINRANARLKRIGE